MKQAQKERKNVMKSKTARNIARNEKRHFVKTPFARSRKMDGNSNICKSSFFISISYDIVGRNSPFKKQEPHATTVQKRIAYRCTCFFEETMTVIKNC